MTGHFCNLVSISACRKNDSTVVFESAKEGRDLCVAEHVSSFQKVFTAGIAKTVVFLEAIMSTQVKNKSSLFLRRIKTADFGTSD